MKEDVINVVRGFCERERGPRSEVFQLKVVVGWGLGYTTERMLWSIIHLIVVMRVMKGKRKGMHVG